MAGLRERKRAAVRAHVQRVALDLFSQHGYEAVTVADVAAEADVAERSVYRHFGTKEGLVTFDSADLDTITEIGRLAPTHDPISATRAALSRLDETSGPDLDAKRRLQMHLLLHEPALETAHARTAMRLGDQLGAALARANDLPDDDLPSIVRGRAIVTALTTAVEAWHRSPDERSLGDVMTDALDALTSLAS